MYEKVGLLRSFTVASADQGKGIGRKLYDAIIAYGRMHGGREVYLLTITARSFFQELGFSTIERSIVPEAIRKTNEFQGLCPSSVVCMTKSIDCEIFHVTKELLRGRSVVRGATMWAVALDQVMFTYFEIEAGTRVERHTHESEQITYVLEGELLLEYADATVCVKPGECIAIPSNAPHAAYTKEQRVRAVDAWSPVRFDYLS
jgi:quercetin dioxygenase-like cupin family protein